MARVERVVNVNEPVRDLSHLNPLLRRLVEEPWRTKREINRKKPNPPKVEDAKPSRNR